MGTAQLTMGAAADDRSGNGMLWVFPCLCTMGALGCGLSAVRCASEGNFQMSVVFLFLSCLLDGLDGHIARFLKATTELGAELDSLCDLADFGVSPAFITYFWTTQTIPASDYVGDNTLWLACVTFAACCSCRLARFNLM